MVVYPLVVILDAFDAKEDAAQADGCDQEEYQQHAFPGLRTPRGHSHGEAGADQHRGVRRAEWYVRGAAGGDKRVVVHVSVDQVCGKEAAEEHDLRDQEDPHTKAGGIALLIQCVKVVLQRRMMVLVRLLDRDGAVTIRQLPPLLFRSRNRMLRG